MPEKRRKASKSCCNKEPDSPESRPVELRDLPTSPRSSPAVLSDPRSPTERQSQSVSNASLGSISFRSLGRHISMPRMPSMNSLGSLGSGFSSTNRLPPMPLNAYMLETHLLMRIDGSELASLTQGLNDKYPTCKICRDEIDIRTDKIVVHNAPGCGAAYHDECFKKWVIETFYAERTKRWTKPRCFHCEQTLEVYVEGGGWRKFPEGQ